MTDQDYLHELSQLCLEEAQKLGHRMKITNLASKHFVALCNTCGAFATVSHTGEVGGHAIENGCAQGA